MADEIPRSRGVVSKFITSNCYGFIKPDDGSSKDLFFHQSEVKAKSFRMLEEGQVVEFFVVKEGDKTKAVSVTFLNEEISDSGGVDGGSDDGKRKSGGGSGRRNGNFGRGKCNNCVGTGHTARDCDNAGGVLAGEVVGVGKVVGNITSLDRGGSRVGGGDSRHLDRDSKKAGEALAVEAEAEAEAVPNDVGNTSLRDDEGGSRVSGVDYGYLAKVYYKGGWILPAALAGFAKVIGNSGNRVGGGDFGRLARYRDKVGRVLAMKMGFANVAGNIRNRDGGGTNNSVGGPKSRMPSMKDCGDYCAKASVIAVICMVIWLAIAKLLGILTAVTEVLQKLWGISANRDGHSTNCPGFCYTCDRYGRMAKNCRGFCYRCDRYGHMANNCRGFCYRCDRYGHMANNCPGFWYRCDRYGHMANNCPGFWYRYDRYGHMANNCPGFWYRYDRYGHMANKCPGFWYNCERYGHMANNCRGFCYNCNKPGHMASGCTGL